MMNQETINFILQAFWRFWKKIDKLTIYSYNMANLR